MALRITHLATTHLSSTTSPRYASNLSYYSTTPSLTLRNQSFPTPRLRRSPLHWRIPASSASLPPLDLTEDNIRQVLIDARSELAQIFDTSVGITGEVDLVDLDGPFVKISLKGRFWHKRSTVLARIGTYLKNRIPEILEVDIEDEKQLNDSPENF